MDSFRTAALLVLLNLPGCSSDSLNDKSNERNNPQAASPAWDMVWADEFNEPAGSPPNPANWTSQIGDGSAFGLPGWGNQELQYYTDDPANVATDGKGNLVITLRESGESLDCYYGPCRYTSARLVTQEKAEFLYGRIEARILLPPGRGLWSAFWSLGADYVERGWPQTGEIDVMEFVGRIPNAVYGTVHGPGYSGGNSYGKSHELREPAFNDFHVFGVQWEPDRIEWYVDGIAYHTATPAAVPGEWVYNAPVFLVLNLSIGGYFGGEVDPDIALPASMTVDYVRVFKRSGD